MQKLPFSATHDAHPMSTVVLCAASRNCVRDTGSWRAQRNAPVSDRRTINNRERSIQMQTYAKMRSVLGGARCVVLRVLLQSLFGVHSMILITGATDGIGLALARHYADEGADLILIGRKPLSALDPDLFTADTYCQVDLSKSDCAEVVRRFLQAHDVHAVDLAVCNAGVGYHGATEDQPAEDIAAMVAVNLEAPMALTQLLLPYLKRAQGKIAFIGSVVSMLPCPQYAVYGATKAALEDFARNLRIELQNSPVRVQAIRPGAVNTGMHAKSGVDPVAMKVMNIDDQGEGRIPPHEALPALLLRD